MAKINDTTDYATVAPATGDLLIGTDISNTTNDANGETVTFTAAALANLGGYSFIATADASNDASIAFTAFDSSLYDAYMWVLSNVVPANDTVYLTINTSTDGGSSYDTGASDYNYTQIYFTSTSSINNNTFSALYLTGIPVGSAAGEYGVSGLLSCHAPHLAQETYFTFNMAWENNSGSQVGSIGMGKRASAADVDGVRFQFDSGNMESGTITMYGLRNS